MDTPALFTLGATALALVLIPGMQSSQAFTAEPAAPNLAQQIQAGDALFQRHCALCHQANGQGLPMAFPPLAGSDYLLADKDRNITVVLHGLSGKVTVNGKDFNSSMPALSQLHDTEIANILTFAAKAWGNAGEAVSASDVARMRAAKRP